MFEKFDDAAMDVAAASRHECMRLNVEHVGPEHVLIALTRDPGTIAARALGSMNINGDNIQKELDKLHKAAQGDKEPPSGFVGYENIVLAEETKRVFERANDYRHFFGRDKVAPEHLLLGIADLKEGHALRILEELGANLTFLRRQVLHFAAKLDCLSPYAPNAKSTIVYGISRIVAEHVENMDDLRRLSEATGVKTVRLPEHTDIVVMVLLAYLPQFLTTQAAYQRYLLEETLTLLQQRTGPLDKETIATMVSAAAQNLRSDVRAIIEHIWTQEYRMLSQMPDESEHEEIGSIIEDLWWTYSEEIALHEVFDEALDDYRRKHVLNLQKRKLELAQRLTKLQIRLEESLKQCFLKRTVNA